MVVSSVFIDTLNNTLIKKLPINLSEAVTEIRPIYKRTFTAIVLSIAELAPNLPVFSVNKGILPIDTPLSTLLKQIVKNTLYSDDKVNVVPLIKQLPTNIQILFKELFTKKYFINEYSKLFAENKLPLLRGEEVLSELDRFEMWVSPTNTKKSEIFNKVIKKGIVYERETKKLSSDDINDTKDLLGWRWGFIPHSTTGEIVECRMYKGTYQFNVLSRGKAPPPKNKIKSFMYTHPHVDYAIFHYVSGKKDIDVLLYRGKGGKFVYNEKIKILKDVDDISNALCCRGRLFFFNPKELSIFLPRLFTPKIVVDNIIDYSIDEETLLINKIMVHIDNMIPNIVEIACSIMELPEGEIPLKIHFCVIGKDHYFLDGQIIK